MFRASDPDDLAQVRICSNRFGELVEQMVNQEKLDPVLVLNGQASQLASGLRKAIADGAFGPHHVAAFLDGIGAAVRTGEPQRR